MFTLHICRVQTPEGKDVILTEITSEKRKPTFLPIQTCAEYFSVKITDQFARQGFNNENAYKHFLQALYDQGFKITAPDT
ncbi:MAG: hypothetical protein QG585_368 [Patescibacteria group bacterium]|jgi:hypothetical protein|nr:hypothetical protein [Patescibacteria group bacterium]